MAEDRAFLGSSSWADMPCSWRPLEGRVESDIWGEMGVIATVGGWKEHWRSRTPCACLVGGKQ